LPQVSAGAVPTARWYRAENRSHFKAAHNSISRAGIISRLVSSSTSRQGDACNAAIKASPPRSPLRRLTRDDFRKQQIRQNTHESFLGPPRRAARVR
jgi:hypothetical protein